MDTRRQAFPSPGRPFHLSSFRSKATPSLLWLGCSQAPFATCQQGEALGHWCATLARIKTTPSASATHAAFSLLTHLSASSQHDARGGQGPPAPVAARLRGEEDTVPTSTPSSQNAAQEDAGPSPLAERSCEGAASPRQLPAHPSLAPKRGEGPVPAVAPFLCFLFYFFFCLNSK